MKWKENKKPHQKTCDVIKFSGTEPCNCGADDVNMTEDHKSITEVLEEQFMLVEGVTRDWVNSIKPDTIYFYDVEEALKQAGYIHRSEVKEVLEVYEKFKDYFIGKDNLINGEKLQGMKNTIKAVAERIKG